MDNSVYRRPNKPRRIPVTRRRDEIDLVPAAKPLPEPLTVDKATECHVTPPEVAERMAEYLGRPDGPRVLEPSVGTGNLVAGLIELGYSAADVFAVERHIALAQRAYDRFPDMPILAGTDFLDYALCTLDRFHKIIMNPPFSKVKKHMAAAIKLMEPSEATLVALVPTTYQHDEAEELEVLGPDTFSTAKVNTKIIRITR